MNKKKIAALFFALTMVMMLVSWHGVQPVYADDSTPLKAGETYKFTYEQGSFSLVYTFTPETSAAYDLDMSIPNGEYEVEWIFQTVSSTTSSSRNSVINRDYDDNEEPLDYFNCFNEQALLGGVEYKIILNAEPVKGANGTGWIRIQKSDGRTVTEMQQDKAMALKTGLLCSFKSPAKGYYEIEIDSRDGEGDSNNWGQVTVLYGEDASWVDAEFNPNEKVSTERFYLGEGESALIDVYFNGCDADLSGYMTAVFSENQEEPSEPTDEDDINWNAFDVSVIPETSVTAGEHAEFRISIKNTTDWELTPIIYKWYYQEKDNDWEYPGVDFGSLTGEGLAYNDDFSPMITLSPKEEAVFTLSGTIPKTWNDQSQILVVVITDDDSFMGQGGYEPDEATDGIADHELTKVDSTAATCEKPGNSEYWICNDCNKCFSDSDHKNEIAEDSWVIPAIGHIWEDVTYVWSEDNTQVTATRVCRIDATHKETETVNTTSEVTKKATTEVEGELTYTAVFKNPIFALSNKFVAIPVIPTTKGVDGTAVGKGASASVAEKAITSSKSDEGPKGGKYAPLQLRSAKQGNNNIELKWNAVKGAEKYLLYGNACGSKNKMKMLVTTSKKTYNVKKISKKLKKGTYHKFMVVALDNNNNVVSTSKVVHVATKGNKKVANPTKLTVKAPPKTLKKGKTHKLAAKQVGKNVKKHRVISYESTNVEIATVSSKGVITAKSKGTCYVYAYTQNGLFKRVKITVK